MAKRIFDIGVAAVLLVVFAPVLAVIAVCVKRDSTGSILFRQQRVGRFGTPFDIYKVRTMVENQDNPGPQVTSGSDPRITNSGRFLRRYKLDELPQLFNILKGDMSFVGPRPEVPKYVSHWSEQDRQQILSVRPGMTDPATIKFRDEEEILKSADDPERYYIETILPEKLALYRAYIADRTFIGDLGIIAKTLARVLAVG